MTTGNNIKPFRCEYGFHPPYSSIDHETFHFIIHSFKEYGVVEASVSHYSKDKGYGFNYAIDDSGYVASFIQLQPTWGEAAVVCLQTIVQHLKHMGRINFIQ